MARPRTTGCCARPLRLGRHQQLYSTYWRIPPAPAGADADAAPAGGAWLVARLARTLAHCVAGWASRRYRSLRLLRYELPQFFRNLSIAHPARMDSALNGPAAGATTAADARPLRLLTDDYKLTTSSELDS